METTKKNNSAYILTGGHSRRMHGDKSVLTINGKTLTDIIHRKLSPLFDEIFVVGKINKFPQYNFIEDSAKIQCPLNGIMTALNHSLNKWVFVIACDLPLVQSETIQSLSDLIDDGKSAVIPKVDDRTQPICGFYNTGLLPTFKNALDNGKYKLLELIDNIEKVDYLIQSNEDNQFLNINYPVDLKIAQKILLKNINL